MIIKPVILAGDHIQLLPLSLKDEAGLIAAVSDGELWNLKVTLVPSPEHMRFYIQMALQAQKKEEELPFVIFDKKHQKVVGSTRFLHFDRADNQVEIGASFISKSFQKTHVNRESKLLLLQHAFESWGVNRVNFITDERNTVSQKALEKMGATQDEILNEHRIMPDWYARHSLVYTVSKAHWPLFKKHLMDLLDKVYTD